MENNKSQRKKKEAPLPKPKFVGLKLLLGAGLLAIGLDAAVTYADFEAHAVHGHGLVKDVSRHIHTGGRRAKVATVTPMIEFTPEGTTVPIKAQTMTEVSSSVEVGDEVAIEYQPSRPEKTLKLDHGLPMVDGAVGLGGLALFVSGLMGFIRKQQMNRAARVATAGNGSGAGAAAPAS